MVFIWSIVCAKSDRVMADLEEDLNNFNTELEEELVAATPSQRNWKGIAIALLVIGVVIALVALSVVIVSPANPGPRIKGERISLNHIIEDRFKPRHFNGSWVSASELVYTNVDGGISITDFRRGSTREILSNSTFRQLNARSFTISPDRQFILVPFDTQKKFRHSTLSKYAIVNVNTSSYRVVNPLGEDEAPKEPLQLAVWAPQGHSLAFVYQNDIFYQKDAADLSSTVRLTQDGLAGTIFNGVTDWLYEEEIFSSHEAIWFSPDGQTLVYASFNDSTVRNFKFMEYEGLSPTTLYPETRSIRYPKTGTSNPIVQLHLVDLETNNTIRLAAPPSIRSSDHYLVSVTWMQEVEFVTTWLNRAQNTSVMAKYSAPTYQGKEVHKQKVPNGGGWIDPSSLQHRFSEDGQRMIFVEPVRDSVAGYFPQLHEKDISKDQAQFVEAKFLTHGTFHVTQILGWDERRHLVYFLGTLSGYPGVRHMFSVGDSYLQKNKHHQFSPDMKCLTCELNQLPSNVTSYTNVSCEYAQVELSKETMDYYVLSCLGPRVPFSAVISLPENKPIQMLDGNPELNWEMEQIALPQVRDLTVELPGTSLPARVRLLLPPGLREDEEFIFPFMANVYGGPGSQDVSSRWRLEWDHYLSSKRDFIVAHIDVRGTGFSGNDFTHSVYRQLGSVEVEDTMHVLKYLLDLLEFVDKSKVAVWGWSYGGYLATRMLVEDKLDLITCTMAVAPVTDWRLYDTAYTERFMGQPDANDNWKGYETSDLTKQADQFLGRRSQFYLIHGTSDENVHLQHSMLLTQALVAKNVQFKQMFYPAESHALKGVEEHLFSAMEHNLDECLGPIPDFFSNLEIQYSGLQQLQELFTFRDHSSEGS